MFYSELCLAELLRDYFLLAEKLLEPVGTSHFIMNFIMTDCSKVCRFACIQKWFGPGLANTNTLPSCLLSRMEDPRKSRIKSQIIENLGVNCKDFPTSRIRWNDRMQHTSTALDTSQDGLVEWPTEIHFLCSLFSDAGRSKKL
jgi:hypothetical protein